METLFDLPLLAFWQFNLGKQVKFVYAWPDFWRDGPTELADECKLERKKDKTVNDKSNQF